MEIEVPFPEPMTYSFIHISRSRHLFRISPAKRRENIRSPSTEPHADGRPTYSGVGPGSPRESYKTLLLLLQCHAAFSMISSTLVWVDQRLLARVWLC